MAMMKFQFAASLYFFLQIILLAVPTAFFLYGFFLTKKESGLRSDFHPSCDPYPPLYVIHPKSSFRQQNPVDKIYGDTTHSHRQSSNDISTWDAPIPLWRTSRALISTHEEVQKSIQQWKQSVMSTNTTCTRYFHNNETLENWGGIVSEFISCRVEEMGKISNGKTMCIWNFDINDSDLWEQNNRLTIKDKKRKNTLELNSPENRLEFLELSFPTPIVEKVIIIVIDALRFDFVKEQSVKKQVSYHLNQMEFLNSLLKNEPTKSRLYKFLADAPTATVQRLKALMSGTLPTFFEVSESFASSQVSEDTLLNQLWNLKIVESRNFMFKQNNASKPVRGFKSVIMGDDTWDNLFGNHIDRSYPFPSFDIQDLDTVDDGVFHQIQPELQETDWVLLVGHFLGVDHVGHKHQVNHPEMSRKLRQYDEFIKKLVKELKMNEYGRWNKTMLIVLGDHGQTDDGAHGGSLTQETESALFVYAPHLILSDFKKTVGGICDAYNLDRRNETLKNYDIINSERGIPQVDLVPTLAVLLGLPIPFSNLGSIITDVIPSLSPVASLLQPAFQLNGMIKDLQHLVALNFMNAFQIRRYALVYFAQTGKDIGAGSAAQTSWSRITSLYNQIWNTFWNTSAETGPNLELVLALDLFNACREYQSAILEGARQRWTTFGMHALISGLLGTLISVGFSIWVSIQLKSYSIVSGRRPQISVLIIKFFRPEGLVLGILCGIMFSDCFSILEATVIRFIYVSYLVFLAIATAMKRLNRCEQYLDTSTERLYEMKRSNVITNSYNETTNENNVSWITSSSTLQLAVCSKEVAIAFVLVFMVRLGPLFDISEALPGATPDPIICDSIWISRSLCVVWTVGLIVFFKGNSSFKDALTPDGLSQEYYAPRVTTELAFTQEEINLRKRKNINQELKSYGTKMFNGQKNASQAPTTTVDSIRKHQMLPTRVKQLTPIAWLSLAISLFFALGQESSQSFVQSQVLPRYVLLFSLFGIICSILVFITLPPAFGSTVMAPATLCLTILGTLFYPTCLLWGAAKSVSTVLSLGLLLASALYCYCFCVDEIGTACLMILSGFVGFYNLGHRMTFNAIPVGAGFLGLPGFHAIHSILLVFFHTFIIFLWVAVLTVFVEVLPNGSLFPREACTSSITSLQQVNGAKKQPLVSNHPPKRQMSIIFTFSIINLVFCFRMLASQAALIVLRRHLMVWNVFAPKFLYDVQLSFLLLYCSFSISLVNTLFQYRLQKAQHEERRLS